jgi:hypothetical protein
LAWRFQRKRLKYEKLMTTDGAWWQYLTWQLARTNASCSMLNSRLSFKPISLKLLRIFALHVIEAFKNFV